MMDMCNIETVGYEYEISIVNQKIKQGWVVLAIIQTGNEEGTDAYYHIGMRRMGSCSCGERMTTFINETNHWRCDDPTHPGNHA